MKFKIIKLAVLICSPAFLLTGCDNMKPSYSGEYKQDAPYQHQLNCQYEGSHKLPSSDIMIKNMYAFASAICSGEDVIKSSSVEVTKKIIGKQVNIEIIFGCPKASFLSFGGPTEQLCGGMFVDPSKLGKRD